jgi:RNA polymerase sigma-70 factor (ECF subfamily)
MGVADTKAEASRIAAGSVQEAQLIEACRRGSGAAFDLLVWRWERPLYSFVYRYVGDAAVAQDVVQDTFVRVVKSIGDYAYRGSFSTWLYQVAVNLCKDHFKKKRLPVVSLHDHVTPMSEERALLVDQVVDEHARTDAAVEAREREELVRRLLDGLSEEQREVILLREYQGLTFPEIGEVLGVPENTAKARLHRGLRAMRKRLEEEEGWPKVGSGGAS